MRIYLTGAAALLLTTGIATAETVALEDVPAAARDAAVEAAGSDKFDEIGLDGETYEFAWSKDGVAMEVDVFEDGTVEELEEQIEASAVPGAAMDKVQMFLPDMTPDMVEKSTRGDQVWYELEGTFDGTEMDVEVTEDGSQILIAEDTAI